MRRIAFGGLVIVLLAGSALQALQETPPQKEHEWLQQLVGEWTVESEMMMGPGMPPVKTTGSESARAIGGLWVVAELKGTMPTGGPMSAMLTLGYNPEKKKYVGTWVDSVMNHMWHYEGTLDATGKILTLETEGPNMMSPGKTAKYRDVIEIKSKDHKTLTSSAMGEDGKWMTFGTSHYKRK